MYIVSKSIIPDHGDAEVVENVPLAERRGDTTVIIRSNINAGHNVVSLYAAAMYSHFTQSNFSTIDDFSKLYKTAGT